MKQLLRSFCAACARPILKEWKGWPNRDVVPLLPRVLRGRCESCRSSGERIESWRIRWNTDPSYGLPMDWDLYFGDDAEWTLDVARQGSQPYFSEATCPGCRGRTVVSREFNKLARNCPECGVEVLRAVPSVPYSWRNPFCVPPPDVSDLKRDADR